MAEKKEIYKNNVKLPKGQLIWLHAFKPDVSKFGQNKYSATCVLPADQDKEVLKQIKKMCLGMAQERWGVSSLKGINLPFRSGDTKAEKYPWMAGRIFFRSRSNRKPLVVGADRKQLEDETDLYSGCVGRIVVSAGTYESTEKVKQADGTITTETVRGITFFLEIIQKLGEGERVGGGSADLGVLDDDESLAALDEGDDASDYAGGDDDLGLDDDDDDLGL